MKPKPMIFTPWSVRAILEGNKTETRRLSNRFKIKPGDLVWVKEPWSIAAGQKIFKADYLQELKSRSIRCIEWRNTLFMPKKISRLTLEIIDVREERLKDITKESAIAEGIREWKPGLYQWKEQKDDRNYFTHPRFAYGNLWESIHGKEHPWDSNPVVSVFQFKIHEVRT